MELPPLESFDAWIAANHPTPESDPCVPCIGDPVVTLVGPADDFVLNMSQSRPLPSPLRIDAVYLRLGSQFYPLGLSPETLAQLADGQLESLLFSGWGGLILSDQQGSLVYVIKQPGADCVSLDGTLPDQCFWSSTPILWLFDG